MKMFSLDLYLNCICLYVPSLPLLSDRSDCVTREEHSDTLLLLPGGGPAPQQVPGHLHLLQDALALGDSPRVASGQLEAPAQGRRGGGGGEEHSTPSVHLLLLLLLQLPPPVPWLIVPA